MLDPDMLELLHRILKKTDADIAECSYRNIYKDHVEDETRCTAELIEGDRVFALEGMLDWRYFKPVAWNKLYKRTSIGEIRYPVGKLHEDEFTTYKFFYNSKKLVYIDVSKYNYDRTREDSITGKGFREDNLDACWAFRERVDFLYKHKISSLYKKMNNIYCWYVIESLYKCYDNSIYGTKVDRLLKQIREDLLFFADKEVEQTHLDTMTIICDYGLEAYGKRRKTEKYE